MTNEETICIIGGYDDLSKSLFKILKNKYKSTIFINLLNTACHSKSVYNYNIFELKKILTLLKLKNVKDIIFLGKIVRPDLSKFKNDGVVENYIPILVDAYKKGDGAVLDAVVDIFIEHNFRAVSPFKYCDNFCLSNSDVLKTYKKEDIFDIKKSSDLLDSLSEFDNAQSVVCAEGYIIAIEAVEGTDALLRRSWQLRKDLGQIKIKSGFLVKKIKKNQSRIVDLPVVGPKTINLIKKANLKGLAIDIKNTLIYKKNDLLKLAKKNDLIIYNIN
ncbi:MAG: UDP-2,3-diacylglucosamine diphosphatase LpxI domain-containing protein [Candidatus Pelagibacterales bacterium]